MITGPDARLARSAFRYIRRRLKPVRMGSTASQTSTRPQALSVTQLANRIDGALRDLGDGWIEGEVRAITQHSSGHVYLTLADEDSNLDACIWKLRVKRCLPLPKRGDLVQAHDERIDFYAARESTEARDRPDQADRRRGAAAPPCGDTGAAACRRPV